MRHVIEWTVIAGGAHGRVLVPTNDDGGCRTMQRLEPVASHLGAHGASDRLTLVDLPRTAGSLHAALDEAVSSKVIRDVHKDFTKLPDHELPSQLEAAEW